MALYSGIYLGLEGTTAECNTLQQERELVFDTSSGLLRYKKGTDSSIVYIGSGLGGGSLGLTLTSGYVPVATSTSSLGDSAIRQIGSNIVIMAGAASGVTFDGTTSGQIRFGATAADTTRRGITCILASQSWANSYYSNTWDIQKTGGTTSHSTPYYGSFNRLTFNQVGGVLGETAISRTEFKHDNGTIGAAGNVRPVYLSYNVLDLNVGTITGDVVGTYIGIDQVAAHTVSGDLYGALIKTYSVGTKAKSLYGLYIDGLTGTTYGLVVSGVAPSYFHTDVTVKGNFFLPSIASETSDIVSTVNVSTKKIGYRSINSGVWASVGTVIAGVGTNNTVAKFSGTTGIVDSIITATGSGVGISETTPDRRLEIRDVNGAPQLRLTYTAGSNYTDLHSTTLGKLALLPLGSGVAINSTTANYALDVYAGLDNIGLRVLSADDTCSIRVQDNDTSVYLTAKDGYCSVGPDSGFSGANVVISSSGVGIGTGTGALGRLHVQDSTAIELNPSTLANLLVLEANYDQGVSMLNLDNKTSRFVFGSYSNNIGSALEWCYNTKKFNIATNTASGYLTFSAGSNSEKMRLTTDGKLGIGTSTPSGSLHIKTGVSSALSPNAIADELILESNGDLGITMMAKTDQAARIAVSTSTNNLRGVLSYSTFFDTWEIAAGAAGPQVRINYYGIGVGTTAPYANEIYAVNVSGSVYINNRTALNGSLSLVNNASSRVGGAIGSAVNIDVSNTTIISLIPSGPTTSYYTLISMVANQIFYIHNNGSVTATITNITGTMPAGDFACYIYTDAVIRRVL